MRFRFDFAFQRKKLSYFKCYTWLRFRSKSNTPLLFFPVLSLTLFDVTLIPKSRCLCENYNFHSMVQWREFPFQDKTWLELNVPSAVNPCSEGNSRALLKWRLTCPNIPFLSLAIELNTETATRSSNGTRGETLGFLFYFKGATSLSLRHIVLLLWGNSFISFHQFFLLRWSYLLFCCLLVWRSLKVWY